MSQPYGAGISGSSKESGQSNRSGPNFNFLDTVPTDDTEITVNITGTPSPDSVSFKLMQDKSFSDPSWGPYSNGDTFKASDVGLDAGNDYYLADPSNATEDFVVYFSA